MHHSLQEEKQKHQILFNFSLQVKLQDLEREAFTLDSVYPIKKTRQSSIVYVDL